MKNIKVTISLICSTLLAPSCLIIDGGLGILDITFFVFLITCLVMAVQEHKNKKRREEGRAAWKEKRRIEVAQEKALEEEKHAQYMAEKSKLVDLYGEADKTIQFTKDDINQEIRAYVNRKVVFILGKEYDFSSILQCTYSDDSQINKGSKTVYTTGTSKTDNGSMLGRAIVGEMIAGPAGAIIGGSTASRTTEQTSVVHRGNDRILHNYTVWITTKDISNPIVEIPIGKDERLTNEVVALMNAILASLNIN